MPTFDHITNKGFRESLEADDAEMKGCFEVSSWKSVHVLSGSIVEALLVDYLVSTKNPSRPPKDPLKLDLGEAIAICKTENAISERTADLCSVIRSYRNLIHPGRMIRLAEPHPDRESATIAAALVEIIAAELAKVRRAVAGLTAEQLMSKIERDANCIPLLKHLLAEVNDEQRLRLLLELIPNAYSRLDPDDAFDDRPDRFATAFRMTLENSSPAIRTQVATDFVRLLREGGGTQVSRYSEALFKPKDLHFVPEQHKAIVREHLFARVPHLLTLRALRLLDDWGDQLEVDDAAKWLDIYLRSILSTSVNEKVKERVRAQLMWECEFTSEKVDGAIAKRFDAWIRNSEGERAENLKALKSEIESQRLPF